MDPNETLKLMREALAAYETAADHGDYDEMELAADNLATHVRAMDEWMSKGGFAPRAWRNQ